jgi:hypothetical protein
MNKNARCVGERTLPRAASRATEIGYAAMNTITMKNLTICDASYVATWCDMWCDVQNGMTRHYHSVPHAHLCLPRDNLLGHPLHLSECLCRVDAGAGVSPVSAQMWQGRAQSRYRCDSGHTFAHARTNTRHSQPHRRIRAGDVRGYGHTRGGQA